MMSPIPESYESVKERITGAAESSGRDPSGIELIAVSKTWPADTIAELAECGHDLFGENRVQELEAKVPALPARLRWHFIGHLQKNKIRKVLPVVETIHSVDSSDLAGRINRIAADLGLFPKIYLQVNTAGEAGKFGFSADEIRKEFDALLELERIEIIGLMAIPPLTSDPEATRREFTALRELRDELTAHSGLPLTGLSMGMSHDYEIAIEEGSTAVRVGSSIFGTRKSRKVAG
ncbi:MAG: YggS family pyridoxal phosphate-dependent enzyme [Verrucomicrobiales bacterium]